MRNRPRGILAFLIALGLVVSAAAAWRTAFSSRGRPEHDAPPNARPPRAETTIEVPSGVHDFGPVLQSEQELSHVFRIHNRGNEPVDVRVLRVGCGCLEVKCPPVLPAGGTDNFEARLTLGGREGPLDVSAQLETSEPGAPGFLLTVRCNIVPDVRLDPPRLEFTGVQSGEKLSAECRVITAAPVNSPVNSRTVDCITSVDGVVAESLGTTRPEGLLNRLERTVHRFRVRIDTALLARHNDHANVSRAVVFRCPQFEGIASPALSASVEFRHHDHLAGPTTIALRKSRAAGQAMSLKSLDGLPFVMTSARASSPEILIEKFGRSASAEQTLQLRFRDPLNATSQSAIVPISNPAIQKCSLTILTDRWPNEPYEVEALLLP